METLFSLTVLALPLLARGLAEAVQRANRRRVWTDHPVAPALDAFRGHKIAQLIVGPDDEVWLAGVTSLRYGVDELARCRRRSCRPPGLDCRCGFYAFRDRSRAIDLFAQLTVRHPARSYVLLTVDLDGEVLEYDLGFRAQRQRVLRIEVPAVCIRCLREGRRTPAEALVAHPHFRGEQLLYERTLLARLALPLGSAPIRPACTEHTPVDAREFSLDRLRSLTATEVGTLPSSELPPPETAAAA